MGEPLPGDIPDPIYLKTTNVPLDTNVIVNRGDWLFLAESTGFWDLATTLSNNNILAQHFVQAQEDQNTTGLVAGEQNAAAFGGGSWVYAFAGGDIDPEHFVIPRLVDLGGTLGTKLTFVESFLLTTQNFSESAAPADAPAGTFEITLTGGTTTTFIRVGGTISVSSSATPAYDGTHVITSILTNTTFTVFKISGLGTPANATDGVVNFTANNTILPKAKFIKKSGDTVVGDIAEGEIGVFSLLGGLL